MKFNNYYRNYKLLNKEKIGIYNYINNSNKSEFIAVLEVPSIKLKKGIKYNNDVDSGIAILDYDKYKLGNIILASHSGSCDVCFFNMLDELKKGDYIFLYRDGFKYIYIIDSIVEKKKNTFKLNDFNDSITLITCKKNTDDIQIIIKGLLNEKISYI